MNGPSVRRWMDTDSTHNYCVVRLVKLAQTQTRRQTKGPPIATPMPCSLTGVRRESARATFSTGLTYAEGISQGIPENVKQM